MHCVADTLQGQVSHRLDARLDASSARPLGLALSGGGDSVALLALAAPWARRCGRRLIAFSVDHGLNPDSAGWNRFAGDLARRLGAEPVSLRWTGPKPEAGLPAAARAARHALIATTARELGAAVVLFAHTAEDVAEGEWMRSQGATLGRLREWAPSPAWPEGRDVFLLRPLLAAARADLRALLRGQELPWLDDPANADPRFLRTQARSALASDSSDSSDSVFRAAAAADRTHRTHRTLFSESDTAAMLAFPRHALDRETLAPALLCASGRADPPRAEAVDRLLARLHGPDDVLATLAGARLEARGDAVRITREAGRNGFPSLALHPGEDAVWDGRWLVATPQVGVTVRALGGVAKRLPPQAREALAALPALVRPTLPAFVAREGTVSCPVLEGVGHAARSLVADRFHAAIGDVHREADIQSRPPLLAR